MANPKRYSEKVNRKDDEKKSGMQIPSGSYNMMDSLSIIKPLFEPHFKSIHSRGGEIHAKLEISQPGDKHEQEADEVASKIVRGENAFVNQKAEASGQFVLRKKHKPDYTEKQVQDATYEIMTSDSFMQRTYISLHHIPGKDLAEKVAELSAFFSESGEYKPLIEFKELDSVADTPEGDEGSVPKKIDLDYRSSFEDAVCDYMHEMNHYIDLWYASEAAERTGKKKERIETKTIGIDQDLSIYTQEELPFVLDSPALVSALGESLTEYATIMAKTPDQWSKKLKRGFKNTVRLNKVKNPTELDRIEYLKLAALEKYVPEGFYDEQAKGFDNPQDLTQYDINKGSLETGYAFEKQVGGFNKKEKGKNFNNWFAEKYKGILDKYNPKKVIPRKAANSNNSEATSELDSQLMKSKGSGQSLDAPVKTEMESKMGVDLSDVKIHTGTNAHEMSESINAKAFAHGQDIYFKQGNYNTDSKEGKELLAHEVTHTVQQSEGVKPKIQRQPDVDDPSKKVGFVQLSPPVSTMVKKDNVSMRVSDNSKAMEMHQIQMMDVVEATWKSDSWAYCTVGQDSGYIYKFDLIAFQNDDKLPAPSKVTWGGEPFEISLKSDQDKDTISFVVKYTGTHKAYDDLFLKTPKTQFENSVKWSDYYAIQTNLKTNVYQTGDSFIQYDLFSDLIGTNKVFATVSHESAPRDFNKKHFIEHNFSVSLGSIYKSSGAGMTFYIDVPDLKGKENTYTSKSGDVQNDYNKPITTLLPADISLKEVSMSVNLPGKKILYKDPGDWTGGSQAETLDTTAIKITLSSDYLLINLSPYIFLRPTGLGGAIADDFEWYSAKYDFKTKKVTSVDIRYAENYGANVGMDTAITSIQGYIEGLLVGTRMGDQENYNPFTEKDLVGTLLLIVGAVTGDGEAETATPTPSNESISPSELTGLTFSVTSQLKNKIEHLDDGTGIVLNADTPITMSVTFNGTVQDIMDYDKPNSKLSINEVVVSGDKAFVIKFKNKDLLDLKQMTIHNGGEVSVDNFDLYGWMKDIEDVEKGVRGLLGLIAAIAYIARYKKTGALVPPNAPMPNFVKNNLTKTASQIILEDEIKSAVLEQLTQYHDAMAKLFSEDTPDNVRQKFDFYKLLNITPPTKTK